MDTKVLEDRIETLKNELKKTQDAMVRLNDQSKKAEIHYHTISGHLNEASYLLSQVNKPIAPIEPIQEIEDGKQETNSSAI